MSKRVRTGKSAKRTSVKRSRTVRGAFERNTAMRGRAAASRSRRAALSALANATTAGFLGLEKKFYDTSLLSRSITAPSNSTGGVADPSATSMISTPTQGDGEQNREGKRMVIKSCQIHGVVELPASEGHINPPQAHLVHVALVLDRQSNGAQCTSEQIYKNLMADARGNACLVRNLLYANRFQVLKSQLLDLTPTTLTQEGPNLFASAERQVPFSWYVPMDLQVNFTAGTTADINNVVDNSLHVVVFSTDAANAATLSYNARIRFMG